MNKKEKNNSVPFVDEVEEFNTTMGKPNNYEPTIPEKKEWKFVYDFILEELEEYKHACETGDIVEVLDALCDIAYVSVGNGTMLHGLKDKIWPAYQEVQGSNMSKACPSEEDAQATVELRSKEQNEPCHYEKVGKYYIVYRTRDKKVMKKAYKSGNKELGSAFYMKQYTMKILLNSLYGATALGSFRYGNVILSEAITLSGQRIIQESALAANRHMNRVMKKEIEL